jgi:uncharacterized membrane protein YedE/YeeE
MANFTPIEALIGGALIGMAALMLMALNGRVAGISGIAGGLFSAAADDIVWRVAFVAGLVVAPLVYAAGAGGMPQITLQASTPMMVVAGLLVGFGSRLGAGCTSGHGVCGMARMSRRSMAATMTFMATGAITVFVVRHVIGG